ncbi:AAA family ATPase [Woodsholea maritima]|uniref:AAA family ATPase n=1 Tax=Woodsholea maritima TaxID=240237 RepID=UPI00037B30EA|nr:ATP-binding protein [Woodsholea maritima]
MSRSHWHYPRREFAGQVYDLLAHGPVSALSLFGPRRTGKTQFLTHDLGPLAREEGHRVVYVSFWQTLDSPLGILLYEFDRALRTGNVMDRLRTTASDLAPKFKLKTPDGTGEIEVDLANLKGQAPESLLLLLDQYCERLANDDKPAFLLFDEFQELARSKASAPLISALRTSLDKRRDGLATLFTGSSPDGLRRMFTARAAPFFRFASPIELPALDERFVNHQIEAFRKSSKARLDRPTAMEVFDTFEQNPLFFQRWLTTVALHPDMDPRDAVQKVQDELSEEFGFGEVWLGLSATQRLVARMLADHVTQLYGQAGADFIKDLTGKSAPNSSSLQSALKLLSRHALVEKWEEEWRISDPLFENWIRHRPKTDF